ncbi:transposase [Neobacillus novalis]|uniref:Transposase n=1 Tax=Neobacillus novalis TaxID=220687 RepID=A0AA95MWB7_9BACI|nr:transposase [Neobacillus novalis]WHY88566.1 transposase [Neobacillus novalis]
MASHIDHDRLFKELISTFFEEFILLFYPTIYEEIDFQDFRFLSEEIVTDVTEGERYRIDLLVETKLKGEDGLIVIHVESQAQYQYNFNERMFIYFGRLYEKYRRKILPITIFSHDSKRKEPDSFSLDFPFLQVLDFRYLTIQLKKENWRNYLRQNNPVAAALLSKMGYTDRERTELKVQFLFMLLRLKLDPARQTLIMGFFDTYLQLTDDEEQKVKEEVRKMSGTEADKVMEIMNSYERRGRELGKLEGFEEGRQEGREEGRKEGKLEAIRMVAKRMRENGKPIIEIAEITGLKMEEIEQL